MTTVALRKELQQYINHADERFLKLVYAMSKEYDNTLVVGYHQNGDPITKEQLKDRAKSASNRVKSGDYIAQEELENEVKNW